MMSLSSSSDDLGLTNTKKLDRNKSHLQQPVKTPILTGPFSMSQSLSNPPEGYY